jgi:hemoglobin
VKALRGRSAIEATQRLEHNMTQSLYERLGATPGITRLAGDLVDQHLANDRIATRFAAGDVPRLKNAAATFFIGATGGPQVYEGKDLLAAHKGMNISPGEFMAVLDDALVAMEKNKIGPVEQQEVLFAFYSMRSQIVRV